MDICSSQTPLSEEKSQSESQKVNRFAAMMDESLDWAISTGRRKQSKDFWDFTSTFKPGKRDNKESRFKRICFFFWQGRNPPELEHIPIGLHAVAPASADLLRKLLYLSVDLWYNNADGAREFLRRCRAFTQ